MKYPVHRVWKLINKLCTYSDIYTNLVADLTCDVPLLIAPSLYAFPVGKLNSIEAETSIKNSAASCIFGTSILKRGETTLKNVYNTIYTKKHIENRSRKCQKWIHQKEFTSTENRISFYLFRAQQIETYNSKVSVLQRKASLTNA